MLDAPCRRQVTTEPTGEGGRPTDIHPGRFMSTPPRIANIAPLFVVRSVPAALAFYRDELGFAVTFQGPEPHQQARAITP